MDRPEHLQIGMAPDGCAQFPAIYDDPDPYASSVLVYEVADAEDPHVMITAHEGPYQSGDVSLSLASAWRFAEQIMTAVANHHGGDGRPPVEDRVADLREM